MVTLAYPATALTGITGFGSADSYGLDTNISTATGHWDRDLSMHVTDSYSTTSGLVPAFWSEISILFGVPLHSGGYIVAEAFSKASNFGIATTDPTYTQARSAEAGVDLGQMVRWGGITRVLNAQGRPLTDWSVTAESGTDYRFAVGTVAEPASGLCMATGLLGLAVAWRRRRAAPAATAAAQRD